MIGGLTLTRRLALSDLLRFPVVPDLIAQRAHQGLSQTAHLDSPSRDEQPAYYLVRMPEGCPSPVALFFWMDAAPSVTNQDRRQHIVMAEAGESPT